MLIVQGCSFIPDGDGFYRETQPARYLAKLPGVTVVDIHLHHRLFDIASRAADVLILPFVHGYGLFPLLEDRRRNGKITVLETNDYYPGLPPWSLIWSHWQDPDVRQEHLNFISQSDAIQVSCQRLAEHWSSHARQIAVFPNQLSDIPPLPQIDHARPLTIGWAGSQGHKADFFALSKHLEPWLKANPSVKLKIMCGEHVDRFVRLPKSQFEVVGPGSIADYLNFISTLDIGLAPLLPTEYNLCRSDVKFLEYASRGVVGVFSTPGPYDGSVENQKTGLLLNSMHELPNTLDRLVQDTTFRLKIREEAYTFVSQKRRIEEHISTRLQFYQSLLKSQQSTEIPAIIAQAARRDGQYYRLELDSISNQIHRLTSSKADSSAIAEIQNLLSQDGGRAALLGTYGRMLNDLKRTPEALGVLSQAIAQEPLAAYNHIERCRSWLLIGDPPAAFAELVTALDKNPWSVTAWVYFLRFIKRFPNFESEDLRKKMDLHYPTSVRLSLLELELSPPTERANKLLEKIETLKSSLSTEEFQHSAALIVQAISTCVLEGSVDDNSFKLLQLATTYIPDSARLQSIFAEVAMMNGEPVTAEECFSKALKVRSCWESYQREFGPEDRHYLAWDVLEFVRRNESRTS